MADALDNPESNSLPQSDTGSDISALRDELHQLREEMSRMKDEAVQAVLGKIRLQGGGIVTVSGGNGNWTITATGPTGGTVTGTFDCTSDPPVFNGQLTF